jgi:hypothetical protein
VDPDEVTMVDADGHVVETAELELPESVMAEFMRAIRLDRGLAEPEPYPMETAGDPASMMRPGASQPVPRLTDMDDDGIDIAVLYPTSPGLVWVADPEVFNVMAQEYNRWLHG